MNTEPEQITLPNNRSFGLLFVVVFGVLCGWQWWTHPARVWPWVWGGLALVTALVTAIAPDWLQPFNRGWMRLAQLLNRIVSPVVLGLMYALVIVPPGLFMKLIGRDLMHRRRDDAASYWQPRPQTPIEPDSFRNQF